MGYELDRLFDAQGSAVSAGELEDRIEQLRTTERCRYRRLWAYYANPMRAVGLSSDSSTCDNPYRQGQEWGLPRRITGTQPGREPGTGLPDPHIARKEIVIENDIGWRVDTMVIDRTVYGKPLPVAKFPNFEHSRGGRPVGQGP